MTDVTPRPAPPPPTEPAPCGARSSGRRPRLVLATLALLTACGGGGGSSATPVAAADAGAASVAVTVSATAALDAGSVAALGSTSGSGSAPVGSLATAVSSAGVTTDTGPVLTAVVSTGSAGSSTGASALGPADLAVLVAEGDPTSEAIARAYQLARGIPDANIVRVPVSPGSDSISPAEFAALKALVDARLGDGIQATLVTWTQPSRVAGACAMSLTSALAFGYDTRWCGSCNRTQASAYYGSGSARPWSELRIRPSMMLGAATLAEAQALIARGVAADGLMRRGGGDAADAQGWLLRTSDGARSVRYPDFLSLAATAVSGVTMHYLDNESGTASNSVANQRSVMFYFTGLARVPGITSNSYLPGAVADHLTSFGGLLPGGNGQMPATEWLQAGLTGSFGTVEEPCNYTEKFPRASVMVRAYQRGATLIEAYWQSVQWPGQGLFVGEPLARPWGKV